MSDRKTLVRTAHHLREAWQIRSARADAEVERFLDRVADCQHAIDQARTQIYKARAHGLSLVLPMLRARLVAQVDNLRQASGRARERLEPPPVPAIADVVADLRQLQEEFCQLGVDLRLKAVSVHTEPITLENVYLGPFAIRLRWPLLVHGGEVDCFEV